MNDRWNDPWEVELAEAREERFAAAKGRTVSRVDGMEVGSEEVKVVFAGGAVLRLFHEPDCCETVELVDVTGDPADLVGHPLVMCECSQSEDESAAVATLDARESCYDGSHTWTFYKLGGLGGYVTLRWLGVSNGYYSERVAVEFVEVGL